MDFAKICQRLIEAALQVARHVQQGDTVVLMESNDVVQRAWSLVTLFRNLPFLPLEDFTLIRSWYTSLLSLLFSSVLWLVVYCQVNMLHPLLSVILLLLNPHFRSFRGFCQLVEREWSSQRFNLQTQVGFNIFFLFMHSTWLLMQRSFESFEFDESYVAVLRRVSFQAVIPPSRCCDRRPIRFHDKI